MIIKKYKIMPVADSNRDQFVDSVVVNFVAVVGRNGP